MRLYSCHARTSFNARSYKKQLKKKKTEDRRTCRARTWSHTGVLRDLVALQVSITCALLHRNACQIIIIIYSTINWMKTKKKLMVLFVCVLYFACTHNNFSLLYFEMMVEKVCTRTEFFKYIFIFVYFKVFVFGCSMNLILLLGDDHDDTITIYINISTVRRVHTVNALNNITQ